MTKEQLNAIRARVEAGTACGISTQIEIDRDGTTRWINLGPYLCATHEDAAQVRDLVTFIHAAPTDLPALLAEVERLRDVLAAVAAPLSPSAHDLWAGVDMARRALGGKR